MANELEIIIKNQEKQNTLLVDLIASIKSLQSFMEYASSEDFVQEKLEKELRKDGFFKELG